MTQIREKTLKMLERLPDDNIEALSVSREMPEVETTDDAFSTLMKYILQQESHYTRSGFFD